MKVAIATGIFPPDVGGPATFVPMLASDWVKRGWVVEVVTYSDVEDDGVARPYAVRRILRKIPVVSRYLKYLKLLWHAADDASAIFAQDPVAAGAAAWLVSCLRRKRFVLKVVGDFAWEHARVQHSYSGTLEAFQSERRLPLRIRLMRSAERFVARHADRVIVPSKYLAGIVKGWGVQAARIEVIYNGVEPIIRLFSRSEENSDRHRIVTAGRLVPWKGIDTLIAALPLVLEKVPDATLTIVGDGPDETRLRERVRTLKLEDRVTFTGRISREGVAETIASGGVFALVSSYEGFSHQLVEAFQLGAAVVASNAGGNPEIVTDGENGLLVPYGDFGATAKALVRMMQDTGFAAKCGEAAKRRATDFTIENQKRLTSNVIRGGDAVRVLMVSRDASLLDASSRGAARMRLYGERVDNLRIIVLAKENGHANLDGKVNVRLVNAHGLGVTLLPVILAAIREARASGATLVTTQDPFEAGIVAWAVSWWLKLPLAVEEHGGVYLGPYWKEESAKNRLLYGLGLRILVAASGIRAVSVKIESDFRARFPRKPLVRVPVYSEPVKCQTSNVKPYSFGYVGRFVPQKNLAMLLEAFRLLLKDKPDATLVFVGDGPLRESLQEHAAELGLGERVTWLPFQEDVSGAYADIRTLLVPSWYEGWARVVVEAMHCGVPVVMTDVGCAGEVVRDGIEGRITPIGDVKAFSAAMRETLDPVRHDAMARAAAERAVSIESPEALAERMTNFWKDIVGAGVQAPTLAQPSVVQKSRTHDVRVLRLTCDPTVADVGSAARLRLAAEAERIGHLHVIVFARRSEPLQRFHGNFTVDVVNAGRFLASQRLFLRARAAAKGFGINDFGADASCGSGTVAVVTAALRGLPKVHETPIKSKGEGGTRIVVVSRDPMAADAASYASERLANYAERIERFHIVALAKHDAMSPTPVRNYTIEVVDARRGFTSVIRLFFSLWRAVGYSKANLITVQDPFEAGIAAVLVGRLRGVKCVIEDHGAFYVSRVWPKESLLNRFRYVLGLVTLRLASGLRVESQYQLNRYRMLGIALPAVIAPLAMKLPETPLPFRSGPPTFVFAGRFFYEKNVDMLVRAFERVRREVPGVKLVLAGTGPDAEALQKDIDARGFSKDAEIRSWVHNPDDIYRDADVAVTPTDRECWPRFPLEAMAYGLPVVMTDVGNAGAVIRDGIEGFVVEIRDEEGLTRGMMALAKDENLRRKMREAGFEALKRIPANEELVDRIVTFWKNMTGAL